MEANIKIKNILHVVFVILLFNCSSIDYNRLSIEDPITLLSMQDSLLLKNKNSQSIRDALVNANNILAEKYLDDDDLNLAVSHYKKSILIDYNKNSNFGLLIAEGRILIRKGNKNGIWDAIEKFSQASSLLPNDGEPHYWIAIAYTKLGDTDFDLILESYEKSLSLNLDNDLRNKVEKNYDIAKSRKQKLDSFWK